MQMHLGFVDFSVLYLGHFDLHIDLSSFQIVYEAYHQYYKT